MKKALLLGVSCILAASVFGQATNSDPIGSPQGAHSQSLAFTSSDTWIPRTSVTLNVFLTYSGYSSFGLSYWLEVPNAWAPFLSITGVTYSSQFPDPNQTVPNPAFFNTTSGATPGYMTETRDLGATNDSTPGSEIPPGTYMINTLTFAIDAGASGLIGQSLTIRSTTTSPRISEVADTQFNDNNIIPAGTFVVALIPEPSTFALLGFAAATGWIVMGYRRRKPTP